MVENFCGCKHFLLVAGKVLQLCGLYKKHLIIKLNSLENFHDYKVIREKSESLPPRMICMIWYNIIFQFISFMLLFIAAQSTDMLSDKKFLSTKDPQVDQL